MKGVVSMLFQTVNICCYNRMMTKRSKETQQAYDEARKQGKTIIAVDAEGRRFLDWTQTTIIREYDYWAIIANDFPYDTIFTTHDLLLPKRHFAFIRDATDAERHEYYRIKKELDQEGNYESLIENFSNSRSVEKHFHVHLVDWVD